MNSNLVSGWSEGDAAPEVAHEERTPVETPVEARSNRPSAETHKAERASATGPLQNGSFGNGLLLPQHRQMLQASGIADEVIVARGYRSIQVKAELARLGFASSQRSVPTLLLPIWTSYGEIGLYHHRPDLPRCDTKRDRIIKYEFPAGQPMVVDVHPFLTQRIRDPKVPLFITEGVKKADAAISRGLCCIAVLGTWTWRGTNEYGGKTALPDWEAIALKDREIYIAFDSDVMSKPSVYQALVRLQAFLKSRGAR